MSTRSTITVKKTDGKYHSIYVHFDGYIENGVGETLLESYTNQEAAESLVTLGDASIIGDTIDECKFYARDRGEDINPAKTGGTIYEIMLENHSQEFDYVWENEEWYLVDHSNRTDQLVLLSTLVK